LFFYKLNYIKNDKLRIKKIILYLKNNHKNNNIAKKIIPIKDLELNINGKQIVKEDFKYFLNTVPFTKLNNNNYNIAMYSFSLYPTITRNSGHLNFNMLQNTMINLEIDENIKNENMELITVVKELQILRIISGIGSLSWINN
jgi:hypothetical protein